MNTSVACSQVPFVPSAPARDAKSGRFLPGNLAALSHGLQTVVLPPEFAHLAADVETFVAGCVSDEAGGEDMSTRRRSLLEYRARLHRRALQLDAAIEVRGLFDKRGKLRVAWLQQLQSLINTSKGIDSLLGLERKQKLLPRSPAEFLESLDVNRKG